MDNDFLNSIVSRPLSANTVSAPKLVQRSGAANSSSFADVLKQTQVTADKSLKVSAHAESRMQSKGMKLNAADWSLLGQAVTDAAQKGSKDAYICYGNAGFVVNVPNRTVVTAMNLDDSKKVITQIDSVVVVPRLDQ